MDLCLGSLFSTCSCPVRVLFIIRLSLGRGAPRLSGRAHRPVAPMNDSACPEAQLETQESLIPSEGMMPGGRTWRRVVEAKEGST